MKEYIKINTTSDATHKAHTFEIIKEETNKSGEKFYLVKDLKAKKYKYQIIDLIPRSEHFHSLGQVQTEEEAYEWFERYTKRYA